MQIEITSIEEFEALAEIEEAAPVEEWTPEAVQVAVQLAFGFIETTGV
jgi:hypothetical protein